MELQCVCSLMKQVDLDIQILYKLIKLNCLEYYRKIQISSKNHKLDENSSVHVNNIYINIDIVKYHIYFFVYF